MPVRDVLNLRTASAEGIFFGGGDLVAKSCPTLETLWTVACQAPLSVGFSKNTGLGCHFLLQGVFPTQGSNPGLLRCRLILYQLSYERNPCETLPCMKQRASRKRRELSSLCSVIT